MINRHTTIVLGLCVIIGMLIGCSTPPTDPAKKKLAQEWCSKATNLIDEWTSTFSDRHPSVGYEGLIESLKYLDKAIELDPKFTEAWLKKGMTLSSLIRREEALKAFDKVIELDPKSDWAVQAWLWKGTIFQGMEKKYEEEIKTYDRVIELRPKSDWASRAWLGKAGVLREMKKYDEALEAYDKAVEFDPKSDWADRAWYSKAGVLREMGKYDEALKAYNKAIELGPYEDGTRHRAFFQAIDLLRTLKRDNEIIKVYNIFIEVNPKTTWAWFERAGIYSAKKDKENTLNDLARAISLDPKWKEVVKKNEVFQWLWDDEDFKKLTQ